MHNTPVEQTDAELMRCAADGSRLAFEEIVRRHSRRLAEFAAARTNTVQDAEDIVQETFMRAWKNIHTFDDRFAVKNWLFTIAYRLIISGYRKKQPITMDSGVLDELSHQSVQGSKPDWIWELTRRMGGDVHTAMWLRYKQELDVAQIAQVMNKTSIGVRVLLHRARRRLAQRIETLAAGDTGEPQTHDCAAWIERTGHRYDL